MSELNSLIHSLNEQLFAAGTKIFVVLEQPQKQCGVEEVKVFVKESGSAVSDARQRLVCKQECSPSLDQEEPDLPHIKVEQEELWTSLEGEQLQGLNETDIKVTNIVSIKRERDYRETPSPQSVSSDQRETKTEDRDDDWKEPGLITLKTLMRWRKEGSPSVTAREDRSLHSSVVSQPITTSRNTPNRARSYLCQQCGKSFSSLSSLQTHQLVHTGEKPYKCQQCGKSFGGLSNLQTHQLVHTGEKPYLCHLCGKSFNQMTHLQRHERGHTGEKPHNCQQCGNRIRWQSDLKKHQRVYTGDKSHHCQQCGSPSVTAGEDRSLHSSLTSQPITTSRNKPNKARSHLCQECGRNFSSSSNLRTHQLIHTGEKPYNCQQCGKSFRWRPYLKLHKRVHSGEKPYNCQLCGMSFRWHSDRKKHQRVHTGEKPHN